MPDEKEHVNNLTHGLALESPSMHRDKESLYWNRLPRRMHLKSTWIILTTPITLHDLLTFLI